MTWEAWVTLAVVAWLILALARGWGAPDFLVLVAVALVTAVSEITGTKLLPSTTEALSHFGNSGLITVGLLFVVVCGLVQTGGMSLVTESIIGRPTTVLGAQTRIMLPVTFISAFLNNTPVVAMFLPIVDDLCKKARISPSKLYMPMAFAATFGGVCTLIGTSTNLVVSGLMDANGGLPPVRMFDLTWIGVPAAIAGIVYTLVFSRMLLPDRRPPISLSDDPRQYTVEMHVQPGGPLVGKTIEAAGLRHLPGLYLAEIERDGQIIPAVGSRERLSANDRLVFVGIVESVVDLQRIRGLVPATNQIFKLDGARSDRRLIEAVVSDRCPLISKTIREGKFRSQYNAAVIAVARSGRRINTKLGDVELQSGDTLLLEAHDSFVQQQRNSKDFFLVSHVENSTPPRHERAWLALGLLVAMVVIATTEYLDMTSAALLAAVAMILTRCCTASEARNSVDWSVLLVIGGSLGLGAAIERSGAAKVIAEQLIGMAGGNPWLTLVAVYIVTNLFTEVITNNAAAVLVFPIALASANSLDVSFMPFAIVIMVAASAGYATPIGYQTNLMVYGPGGYRYSDYLRFGIPLNLVFLIVTVLLTPLVFPFHP